VITDKLFWKPAQWTIYIYPLLHTPSWRSDSLVKHRGNCTFYLTVVSGPWLNNHCLHSNQTNVNNCASFWEESQQFRDLNWTGTSILLRLVSEPVTSGNKEWRPERRCLLLAGISSGDCLPDVTLQAGQSSGPYSVGWSSITCWTVVLYLVTCFLI
jgi:hypothetical protein